MVKVFESTSVVANAMKEAPMAAEARLLHKALSFAGSKTSIEKNYESCRSLQKCLRTRSRTRQNRNSQFSESNFTVSMSDIDYDRKSRRNLHLDRHDL